MRITRSIAPNLFTLVNLFMGFSAIVAIANGDITKGAYLIIIGGIFDMLDGMTARLINASSQLGIELDSLCDVITFGSAPSFMLYKVYFYQLNEIGILLSALPLISGAIRLARFNTQVSGFEDKKYFRGLPIPASALTIISFLAFIYNKQYLTPDIENIIIYFITFTCAAAMVSDIKYENIPRYSIRYIKQYPARFSIFNIALIICIVTNGLALFPFLALYITFGAIRHFILWLLWKPEAVDDIDESELEEPGPFN